MTKKYFYGLNKLKNTATLELFYGSIIISSSNPLIATEDEETTRAEHSKTPRARQQQTESLFRGPCS